MLNGGNGHPLHFEPVGEAALAGYIRMDRKNCELCGVGFNREIPVHATCGERYCRGCSKKISDYEMRNQHKAKIVRLPRLRPAF